jgi:rod shape-determining protein MreC
MAPPPNRRSGYSRRAQYNTFFGYIAGALGALVGAILLIISIASPSAFSWLRGLGSDAARPASATAARARSEGHGLIETVQGYFAAGRQNARLRRELDEAKVRLIESDALAEENRRLKALLDLAQGDPKPVAVARLIGSTSSSTRRFATLSAGSSDGVTIGMPVRSQLGLVGRVLETGYATSRVLLITDTESMVPVRRASDGVAGFAQGKANGTLQIRLINLGINPLKPGDAFVTSGSGGLYRPGIPIAVARTLLRDGAIAQVLSDPAATEFVTVEPVWAPEAVSASAESQAAPKSAAP